MQAQRSMMRFVPYGYAALVGVSIFFSAAAFAAPSCSARQKACHVYCNEKMPTATQCDPACDGFYASCMETGCWDSPITGKKCGYDKK